MKRHLTFLSLVVICLVMLMLPTGHSEAFVVKSTLKKMPVTGRLADGGTFAGRLTVERFTVDDIGQLSAIGVLTGTAITREGTTAKIPQLEFNALAPLLDLRGTCTTLFLDLEPIFLDSLGQEVALVPVTLDLKAVPKEEHLLRTALCALARLQG